MLTRAFMLSGGRVDAENAVAEAYAEAWRRWDDRLGGYDAPEAWVHRVMRQRLAAEARRSARQSPWGCDLDRLVPTPGADLTAEVRAVFAAIGELQTVMRYIVVSHCLHGVKLKDIAAELNMPPGAVRYRLHEARVLLKRSLGMDNEPLWSGEPLVPASLTQPAATAAAVATLGAAECAQPDPYELALCDAELWLTRWLADAPDSTTRIRAKIIAARNKKRRQPGWKGWFGR